MQFRLRRNVVQNRLKCPIDINEIEIFGGVDPNAGRFRDSTSPLDIQRFFSQRGWQRPADYAHLLNMTDVLAHAVDRPKRRQIAVSRKGVYDDRNLLP